MDVSRLRASLRGGGGGGKDGGSSAHHGGNDGSNVIVVISPPAEESNGSGVNAGQRVRCILPYFFLFRTFAKRRWVGRPLTDVFAQEFAHQSVEFYREARENGRLWVERKGEKVQAEAAADSDVVIRDGDEVLHRAHRHEPPVLLGEASKALSSGSSGSSGDPNDGIDTVSRRGGGIRVVFESEDVLCVDKPASWPVHPAGPHNANTVLSALRETLEPLGEVRVARRRDGPDRVWRVLEAGDGDDDSDAVDASSDVRTHSVFRRTLDSGGEFHVVHRLDRPTSGLLILAKTKAASQRLSAEIQGRDVAKVYVARVAGIASFPSPGSGSDGVRAAATDGGGSLDPLVVEAPMVVQNPAHGPNFAVADLKLVPSSLAGKVREARTSFWRVPGQEFPDGSGIVVCSPSTGRKHQIRVHLQYLGHAIANDSRYAPAGGSNEISAAVAGTRERRRSEASASDKHGAEEGGREGEDAACAGSPKLETAWNAIVECLVPPLKGCKECAGAEPLSDDDESGCIWLHSLAYMGNGWRYETDAPQWAGLSPMQHAYVRQIIDSLDRQVASSTRREAGKDDSSS